MDLIYMNAEKEDIGVVNDHTLDLAFGSDENDFECKVVRSNHCCEEGYFLYYEGTEYGGIIDDIESDTEKDEITYHGRTWHGILNSKILEPDAGEDHLVVSGEANNVLGALIARMDLPDLFVASTEDSGITITSYKMNRYIEGYDGIRKMLKASGAKLNIIFKNGFVELSAKPIVDYSKDEQFDKDLIGFVVNHKGHPINHVICLGKGDLADREVIHVYADRNGRISTTQVFTGIEEVVEVYENTNAEDSEELKQGGIDIINEAWASDEVDVTFNFEDENFDIGDIVGADDKEVGVSVRREITKKIVSIKNGEATISYPTDTGGKTGSSSGGGSSGSGGSGGGVSEDHIHEIEDVTGLQDALDGKAESENAEFTGYMYFNNAYATKYLGQLSGGTHYSSLDSQYKDGTYHRMWRLRFPAGKNFWGAIRVTVRSTYNSFNATGVMSKYITLGFNTTTLYVNIGRYDRLGYNVDKDYRISEAIWNAEAGAYEILIWQEHLNGNNSPYVQLEMWGSSFETFDGITAQAVELSNATTYTASKASPTLGNKTVTWLNRPVFETPYGEAVEVKGHTHEIANVNGLQDELNLLNGATFLGDFRTKTIADLQSALDTWLESNLDVANASAVFSAGNDWTTCWNSGDTATTIGAGGYWTVTVIARYPIAGYTQLRVSYYNKKAVYCVHKNGSIWYNVYRVAFKDEIDALDVRVKELEESGGSGGGSNVASDITISAIAGLTATNVQDALAELLSKIPNQVLPTVQSGSFTTPSVEPKHTYSKTVTFDTPFATTPKVTASSSDDHFSPTISNITQVGFTITMTNSSSSYGYVTTITWNAYTT